jgi:glycine oxidase
VKAFDVAIIGGGIIGSSIAFELAVEKLDVVLLDREEPGRGASWAAAGMLSPGPDSAEALPLVPLAKESLQLYPQFIGRIEEASEPFMHFASNGALQIFSGPLAEIDRDKMVSDFQRLGIEIESVSLETARKLESSINPSAQAAAWLPRESTVDPRSLMDSILAALRRRNVEIRAGCSVTSISHQGASCTGVTAGGEEVKAKFVIVAAGCHSASLPGKNVVVNDWLSRYAPTRPVRGQMLALHSNEIRLHRVLRSDRGYLVPRHEGRIVAGSTLEDVGFDKGLTAGGIRKILDAAIELAPKIADAQIVETWAGLRPGSPDNLPIIGPTDIEGLFIATGHYRNGILLAPVTAKIVRDWVRRGQMPAFTEIFSPLRFTRKKLQANASRGTAANS